MRILKRNWVHLAVLAKSRQNRWDLPGWLIRRPLIAAANGLYEMALLFSGRAPTELKLLAGIKAAMLTHCEFCIDISDTLGRSEGFSEEKLIALVNYRDSDVFTHLEKLCIQFAEEMSRTPAILSEGLREELLTHLSKAQLMEIAAEVAWENQRGRLNQGLGIRPMDTADGTLCLIPQPELRRGTDDSVA